MNTASPVEITFRIPGIWTQPGELIDNLPVGYRLTPEALILPDSSTVEFSAYPADDQFAEIFRHSLRRPAHPDEFATVDAYKVNACLSGPGGSLPSALRMMQAAAALVQAGGAGVFIDNSGLAFGGRDWLTMTEDGDSDAISFAFVAIVADKTEAFTIGMHVLGLREIVMKRADLDEGDFDLVEVTRYVASGTKPVGDGHVIGDLSKLRFRVAFTTDSPTMELARPMHNPFGRMKLVSMRDEAEAN